RRRHTRCYRDWSSDVCSSDLFFEILRQELVQNLEEGQVIDGVVKNITDYGAFVDLGGIDGLLHVTDIAWRRVNHPTEVLNIGQRSEERRVGKEYRDGRRREHS